MEGSPGQLTCHERERIGLEGDRTFLILGTEAGPGDLGSELVLCLDCGDLCSTRRHSWRRAWGCPQGPFGWV